MTDSLRPCSLHGRLDRPDRLDKRTTGEKGKRYEKGKGEKGKKGEQGKGKKGNMVKGKWRKF